MQARFQAMSDNIITKIDEMSGRIDDLERSLGDLMTQAGGAGAGAGAGAAAGGGGKAPAAGAAGAARRE
jgi:hypothetical protein